MAGMLDFLFNQPQQGADIGLLAKLLGQTQPPADAPPSTNDPLAGEPSLFSGGIPLPRPRPPEAGANPAPDTLAVKGDRTDRMQPASFDDRFSAAPDQLAPLSLAPPAMQDQAALPASATPTSGSITSTATPAPTPGATPDTAAPDAPSGIAGLLSNFAKGAFNKLTDPTTASTRLALASGFAGAPSFGTGMQRAFGAAVPAMQSDRAFALKQQSIGETYKSLVGSGVDRNTALAAALNPDILKTVAGAHFDTKPEIKTIKDSLGQEHIVAVQPQTGKILGGGDAGGQGASGLNILAPGKTYDPTLPADDYLNQFGPEMQASIKAYMNGDVMPTGNARQSSISSAAKTYAQTYGMKAGIPVSDELYAQKRKLQTDMGSSSANSIGGIIANGASAFEHLANLGDKFAALGNTSSNIPIIGGHLATAENYAGNTLFPTSDTKAKITAVNDNALKYGQEATKFYAGSGGGEAERMAALHAVGGSASGAEQAAFLETEKQLMLGRMKQKEDQIRDTLGDAELAKYMRTRAPAVESAVARVDANIARLRGQTPQPGQAQPQAQAAPAAAALAQARDAIGRGAPRDAVIQRLQQAGVDPAGL